MKFASISHTCLVSVLLAAALAAAPACPGQSQPAPSPQAPGPAPIAIVPLDSAHPGRAAKVTGALEVVGGKAEILAGGEVTSGPETTEVTLPRRGTLRVCASTTVKLTSDSSVPAGETPGLMMALDHGAMEASFATGTNADVVLTPDFRILIGGPGAAEVKVRLGDHGDTCVDNPGADAPYVLVSSVFEGGAYRVQPGQRVMFEHGSLRDVVDNEKEPCGCPPSGAPAANEFPLAQSEGLAPLSKAPPASPGAGSAKAQIAAPLVFSATSPDAAKAAPAAPEPQPAPAASAAPVAQPAPPAKKKTGFFHRIGSFFRRIFGAEE